MILFFAMLRRVARRPRVAPGAIMAALCWAAATLAADPAPKGSASSATAQLRARTESALYEALAQGAYDRALLILDGARERGLPPGVYHLLKADVYRAQDDTEAEEHQLRGAIHYDPTLTAAHLRLSALLETRGLWLEAATQLRRAISTAPDDPRPYLLLANLYASHQREQDGIEVLQEGNRVVLGNARILWALATAQERNGDKQGALQSFAAAASVSKGDARKRCLIRVGDLSLEAGDLTTALASYREATADGWPLDEALYGRIAASADHGVWTVANAVWVVLEDYLAGGPEAPEREEAYQVLTAGLDELQAISRYVDDLAVPDKSRRQHAKRRYQNSLLCEALVNALAYLDTGDLMLLSAGRDRLAEAEGIGEALGCRPTAPRKEEAAPSAPQRAGATATDRPQ